MSKMRHKSDWFIGPLLLCLSLSIFISPTCAQRTNQTNPEVQGSRSVASLEPSTCVLRRQEELISCRGINHTQLVEALTEIKLQMDNNRQVVEGRKLEDGSEAKDRDVSLEKAASNRTQTVSTRHTSRADIRELTIFSCDLPKLTASSIEVPTDLEILSVVNSGVKEVRPDALSDHALSLTRLTLAHNFLHALPEALKNLTRLEVLDLSHNEIDHLPEGTLLFNLHRLRQLNLDHNKLGQILGAQARLGLRSPGLSLAVFNLEPLRDSLIHLNLAHNALAAFPEQFERPFTRLTSLDLSSNELTEVLPRGFQDMPLLQHLDLSGNRLREFNPQNLSTLLLDLNLRGNPWACTCDAKWILESLQRNTSESSSITSPMCSSPLHLRHRELVFLKENEICPAKETDGNFKVIFVGDDVDGSLKTAFQSLHLLNVTALNHLALIVSWRVDAGFYKIQDASAPPVSWAITLHKTEQDPKSARVTKMKLERYKEERPDWIPGESLYAELLHGLEANTQYTLCIVPVQDGYLFTRPDKCRFATTLEKLEIPTSTETKTTLTTTSTTPTEASTSVIRAPEVVPLLSTKDYRVETERVVMVNEARRVFISWNVTIHPHKNTHKHAKREAIVLQPLGWKITYRQFAMENETDIVLVSRGGEPIQNFTNHYSVEDLEPGTGYTFCFQTLTDLEVQASLRANGRETFDMMSDQHLHSHQDPEVIYSTIRGQPDQTHSSHSVANSIESDSGTNLETSAFDNPPSGIPSVIPPVPSFQPQSINRGIPANIPPVPNFPSSIASFDNSLPSPSSQPTDGNFVYTSTGERIPIPSASSGPSSPFNLPSIVGPRVNLDARQSQWVSSDHPILNIPRNPQQRFTYDFEESPIETTSEQTFIYDFTTQSTTSTTSKQRFTYVERRKRSVNDASKTASEKSVVPGSFHVCKEVVTLKEDNIIAPVAIASTVSTSTTVIVAIVFCCCCPKKCRRKKSGSGWQGRSVAGNNRKISTISTPTPVNVYTRQTSVASGTTISDISNGDLKSSSSHLIPNGAQVMEGDINGHQMKTGRSVSVTSSTGYLTPLPVTNGKVHDPDRVFSEAKSYLPSQKAYINSVKDRLLQQHKDLKEFHPGYDIPPTSSTKSLLGYDYPHPTPVNPIGAHSDSHGKDDISGKAPIPSPSSSDSNYNASVADPRETESLRPEINLNIPFSQNKSSDSSKKFNISKDSDLNKSIDYNYINPGDLGSKPRTYIKNAPLKKKHRKYGSPQRLPDERIAQSVDINPESGSQLYTITPSQSPSYLSHSVPDLATAGRTLQNMPPGSSALQPTDITAAARLNLLIGNQNKEVESGKNSLPAIRIAGSPKKSPAPSVSTEDSKEVSGYVNFPASDKRQSKDHYHTWSSSRPNTPRSRPSLGDVVLTGGTLIEVPEGYVVPKPPKPARSVRLLVPGEDRPVKLDKTETKPDKIHIEYIPPPTAARENKSVTLVTSNPTSFNTDVEKSQITHLMTPELDSSRLVLSTGMAV